MRSLFFCVSLIFAASVLALPQDYTPKVEIGIGYSYSRAKIPNSTSRVNMNGVVIDSTVNMNRWFGLEAEFGTHYHCVSDCWFEGKRVDNPAEHNDAFSFFAGPRITVSRKSRISPWVHSLFGGTKISYTNLITDERMSTSGFGMALGGGLDIPLSAVTIRAVQVDYARYAAGSSSYNDMRVGGGIVIRIGHKAY